MKNLKVLDSHILFYISFGIFMLMTLLRNTFFYMYVAGMTYKAGLALCVLLIVLNELVFGMIGKRGYVGIIVCGAIAALFFVVQATQYNVMAATVLFVFAARKIPFKNIARFAAALSLVFLAVIILSSYIGLIPNYEGIREDGTSRHYIGFLYALYPATVMCNATLLVVYFRKFRIYWRELLLLLLANIWIYLETNSRLVFMISVIGIGVSGLLKLKPDFFVRKKNLTFLLAFAFVICAAASLIISVRYDHDVPWMAQLNTFLGSRLKHQHNAMVNYGFSVFGQDIHANGYGLNTQGELLESIATDGYFYVDNEYIRWFVGYGIVFFLVMLFLLTVFCIKSRKYDRQGYLLIIFVLLAVLCLVQDSFLYTYFNTFLLAIGSVLISNQNESQLEPVPCSSGTEKRAFR